MIFFVIELRCMMQDMVTDHVESKGEDRLAV